MHECNQTYSSECHHQRNDKIEKEKSSQKRKKKLPESTYAQHMRTTTPKKKTKGAKLKAKKKSSL